MRVSQRESLLLYSHNSRQKSIFPKMFNCCFKGELINTDTGIDPDIKQWTSVSRAQLCIMSTVVSHFISQDNLTLLIKVLNAHCTMVTVVSVFISQNCGSSTCWSSGNRSTNGGSRSITSTVKSLWGLNYNLANTSAVTHCLSLLHNSPKLKMPSQPAM